MVDYITLQESIYNRFHPISIAGTDVSNLTFKHNLPNLVLTFRGVSPDL